MRVRDDYRSLSGPEKAAILMLSLGNEHASRVFNSLAEEEIQEISKTMAGLGTVTADVVERLFSEFSDQVASTGSLSGTPESTERLLRKVMGEERGSAIMADLDGPAGRTMWDKLANVNEQVLANYLKNEYPQTVAVVLSRIDPDHAARVIACLPESFSLEVVHRMLSMDAVQKEVVDEVEETLRTEFMPNLARTERRDSHEVVAEIFNGLDRGTENRLMSMLEERNRSAADRIREIMFTFEDLGRLAPAGIQTLLRAVDKRKLAIALKGASEALRDAFFENMSERAMTLLEEDMEGLGPVRLREVDEAQGEIIAIAKELAARGEIVITSGDADDELIY